MISEDAVVRACGECNSIPCRCPDIRRESEEHDLYRFDRGRHYVRRGDVFVLATDEENQLK